MKKNILLINTVLLFVFYSANAQNDSSVLGYLTNKAILGVGTITGKYDAANIFGSLEKGTLNRNTTYFNVEYQCVLGKVFNAKSANKRKTAIESGFLIGNNKANIETNLGNKFSLEQVYLGIPVNVQRVLFTPRSVFKYGISFNTKGVLHQKLQESNTPTSQNRSSSKWSFFSDGKLSLGLNLDVYFKNRKTSKYFGVGLLVEREFATNVSKNVNEIPFSVRSWKIGIAVAPFLFLAN